MPDCTCQPPFPKEGGTLYGKPIMDHEWGCPAVAEQQRMADGAIEDRDRASGNPAPPAPALPVEGASWLDESKPISVGTAPHRWFFDVPDGGIVVSARDLNPIIEHYAEALRAAAARKADVLARLESLVGEGDTEAAHAQADALLLALIADDEVAEAYNAIPKWYA